MMDISKLKEPFPPERVSWRIGSTTGDKTKGMALAYIDARDVQDRLDDVCGPLNWQCRYMLLGTTTVCEIAICCGDGWIWKADGAGATDVESEKGALSDAFKRAAVKWGIGRYLYDLDSPWVEIEQRGKTSIIKKQEYARLRSLLADKSASSQNGANHSQNVAAGASSTPKERAIQWAKEMQDTIPLMPSAAFYAWHNENRDKIAAIKKVDESLHARLIRAIIAKQDSVAA